MARRPRLKLAGITLHIIQRGNNRSACFFSDDDYLFYLSQLQRICRNEGISVHAYVLMTNHVHLLITPTTSEGASQLMKNLGQSYVQYINRAYGRSGTLWDGRFRSCLVEAESYLLSCQRYIELNPVRAKMVARSEDYPWSSYRANAQGENNALLTPHPCYKTLGLNNIDRQAHYRELFLNQIEPGLIKEIRQVTNGGYCLGNDRFKHKIGFILGRSVNRGKPGRPKKKKIE